MLYNYIFSDPKDIPEEYLWSAYGFQHFAWLIGMAIIGIWACIKFKKVSPERQDRILKKFAIWIVIQEIIKDILHYYAGTLSMEHLPLHICGISIFFTLWYAFKPNKLNGAYLYAMSLPGALSALLFPNWTEYPVWHFSAINSFTIHGELILFAMMVLTSRRLIPDIRALPGLIAVTIAMGIPIYHLNKIWGTNFMFINNPSPGSPLMPLYGVFGDGYVAAAVIMMIVAWIIAFMPWVFYRKKHNIV